MSYAPGGHRRRGTVTDAAVLNSSGSQELTSILNAPDAPSPTAWLAWPFAAAAAGTEAPPPLPPGTLPEVRLEDFARYLAKIGDRYDSFEQDRASSGERERNKITFNSEEARASQGQGLVAALREVPALFFQEGFELDRPEVWGLVGEVESDEGRQEALDKLGHYLDVVETQLVREIAARTDNFFDASSAIEDLRGTARGMYERIAAMRAKMSELQAESGAAVQASEQLQRQRANALATLETLKAVEEVAQAQAALQALLPRAAGGGGIATDFVGAIDVLEVLQGVLDNQSLLALDCFRTLPQQIAETAQAVDDLMATDFLERARFGGEGPATSRILQRLSAQLAAVQTPRGGAPEPGAGRRGRLSSEGSAGGGGEAEALAALKLTSREGLGRVLAWVGGPAAGAAALDLEEEGPPGGALASEETLQDVLLPLVMGMRRMGRLSAGLRDLKETSAAGMHDLIRRVVEECLAVLTPGAADDVHLVAGRGGSPAPRPPYTELLQALPGEQFQWVLEAVLLAAGACLHHFARVGEAVHSVLAAAKAPRQQLDAADAECREVCQAVAEVAVARWAKLLSGRAHGGAVAATRLAELREVLDATDMLAALAEAHGVKPAVALRSSLQQMCKATLDAMHAKSLGKLTSLLEQEQWSLVEVPPQFQAVVDRLQARGAAAAAPVQQHHGTAAAAAENGTAGSSAAGVAADDAGDDRLLRGDAGAVPRAPSAGAPPLPPSSLMQPQQAQQQGPQQVQRKYTITPQPEAAGQPRDVLVVAGQRYHLVNTALLLLNMLGDFLAFRDAVPSFGAEVAQRVLELLKIFNSRTCQLVLGAGAMQVSGLKSITAKHLAVSCQCLGAFIALHPALAAIFTQGLPQPRGDMLAADFQRTAQDFAIHRDEICSKLVFIMRERLSMNLKQLPAIAAAWPSGAVPAGRGAELPPPSGFASTNVKQLQILSGVLLPLLLPAELHSIFGRVALMFSGTLVEAFALLEPRGPAWEQQLKADTLALLGCLEQLPLEPAQREAGLERLRHFYQQRFESKPAPEQQPAQQEQQQQQQQQPPVDADAAAAAPLPESPGGAELAGQRAGEAAEQAEQGADPQQPHEAEGRAGGAAELPSGEQLSRQITLASLGSLDHPFPDSEGSVEAAPAAAEAAAAAEASGEASEEPPGTESGAAEEGRSPSGAGSPGSPGAGPGADPPASPSDGELSAAGSPVAGAGGDSGSGMPPLGGSQEPALGEDPLPTHTSLRPATRLDPAVQQAALARGEEQEQQKQEEEQPQEAAAPAEARAPSPPLQPATQALAGAPSLSREAAESAGGPAVVGEDPGPQPVEGLPSSLSSLVDSSQSTSPDSVPGLPSPVLAASPEGDTALLPQAATTGVQHPLAANGATLRTD